MKSTPGESFFARLIDCLEDGVLALDLDKRLLYLNPAAQQIVGLSLRQARRLSLEEIFPEAAELARMVATARDESRAIASHSPIPLRTSQGISFAVSLAVSPLLSPQGQLEGVTITLRDPSRLSELDEAERRADRLTMLGTLAAGLAHEIKNPLGGIKGAAQLLQMEIDRDSPLAEYLRVMIREVERVNGIIEELLALGSPRPPRFEEVNLAKIIGNIVLFQKEAHRRRQIEFVLNLDPSIPPLVGDENHLTQLFLNLVKNAAEAVETAGLVEISTQVASRYHVATPGERPTPLIRVAVRDNGRGIPLAELEQIFTPFYTTKTGGSGLGLATCQKIVEEHHGFIKVESNPESGTVFAVFLPLRQRTAGAETTPP